jgi:membrane protease YdiL (CAAX protease family)
MIAIIRAWNTTLSSDTVARAVSARLTVATVIGHGALIVAAVVWIWARHLPVQAGRPLRDVFWGLGAAAVLSALNYTLLRVAPAIEPVRSLRTLYWSVVWPVCRQILPRHIVCIAVVVGLSEELFFRGSVQGEFGVMSAALLFGLFHVRRREAFAFGLWAVLMGLAFSWLEIVTSGLTAPIVAHATYDAAALFYTRSQPEDDFDGARPPVLPWRV